MKLKYDFTFIDLGDETVGVSVGQGAQHFRGILQCNETASAILTLLKKDTTPQQIIADLREAYDSPDGELEQKVYRFIELLREKDLLS